MSRPENSFLIYWEVKPKESAYIIGDSQHCQGVPELIIKLREIEKANGFNVQIFTVTRSGIEVITKELLNDLTK